MKIFYISQPITGQDFDECRSRAINWTAFLLQYGTVFSPFLHTEAFDNAMKKKHSFYMKWDLALMRAFDSKEFENVLFMLDGWEESNGCKQEKELAEELGWEIALESDDNFTKKIMEKVLELCVREN